MGKAVKAVVQLRDGAAGEALETELIVFAGTPGVF